MLCPDIWAPETFNSKYYCSPNHLITSSSFIIWYYLSIFIMSQGWSLSRLWGSQQDNFTDLLSKLQAGTGRQTGQEAGRQVGAGPDRDNRHSNTKRKGRHLVDRKWMTGVRGSANREADRPVVTHYLLMGLAVLISHPFSIFHNHSSSLRVMGCWSLSQLTLCERRVHPGQTASSCTGQLERQTTCSHWQFKSMMNVVTNWPINCMFLGSGRSRRFQWIYADKGRHTKWCCEGNSCPHPISYQQSMLVLSLYPW